MYTYAFQFLNLSTGEIVPLRTVNVKQSQHEFWTLFGHITDWLHDHPERRCVITREGSDTIIDLTHTGATPGQNRK